MATEEMLRNENESLKSENARLLESNTILQAQRMEYLDFLCGPPEENLQTEKMVMDGMTNFIPVQRALSGFGRTRAALKLEVARLTELNRLLQAQRSEYLDILMPGSDRHSLDEHEVTEQMSDTVPFGRFLNELGIRRLERP